ncbi:MAG: hypothetical protein JRH16_02475 [Deltaproteobacteria bacterium]|nr:hypothetical protein [Deltaproteobacteria bacterium]MBW2360599.1 hypothetical protein [Deltaproteobacteria bacterium]
MEREDWESAQTCAQCGTSVAPGSGRGFEFGTGNLLCWNCAMERGGRYDAERDTWTVSPDVADLPDEAYGAAPHEVQRRRD